jgi:hypothetical protein
VIVLRSSEDARVLAVLWSLACHPVAFPRREVVSAEFPGVVRAQLRARFGAATPVVFLQGCAGNVRPRLGLRSRKLGTMELASFAAVPYVEWSAWAEGLGQEVVALAERAQRAASGPVSARRIELPLKELIPSAEAARAASLHRVSFGPELGVLGTSAEPVAEYADQIADQAAPTMLFPVGYIDEVYGYLPTQAVLREGGYEAEGFFLSFGLEGHFAPGFDGVFHDALARVARD